MYDFVFITNIPSFYKINLYNLLAKKYKIKVIFIAAKSKIRSGDFYAGEMNFDHKYINESFYEERSKFITCYEVAKEITSTDYKKIIYPGWEVKELFFISLITPKSRNCVAVESSILETRKSFLIWHLKKLFMKRMSIGLPSGELQKDIFSASGFKGDLIFTNGVGVLNKKFYNINSLDFESKSLSNKKLRYLYVGRIAQEKNLELMCKVFSEQNKQLSIIGYGPLETSLKAKFDNKITFLGSVNNEELLDYYKKYDVFVLPSRSEPWGLVVEEALCSGLVIICSDMVGSKKELVLKRNTGTVFLHNNEESLINAINIVEDSYEIYKRNVLQLDRQSFLQEKIIPYTKIINRD